MPRAGITTPPATAGPTGPRTEFLAAIIDGGDYDLASGMQATVYVPFACTVVAKVVALDASGSASVDAWNRAIASGLPADAHSITAAAPIAVAGSTGARSTALTGWTVNLAADSLLTFNVDSVSAGVKRALVGLVVQVA